MNPLRPYHHRTPLAQEESHPPLLPLPLPNIPNDIILEQMTVAMIPAMKTLKTMAPQNGSALNRTRNPNHPIQQQVRPSGMLQKQSPPSLPSRRENVTPQEAPKLLVSIDEVGDDHFKDLLGESGDRGRGCNGKIWRHTDRTRPLGSGEVSVPNSHSE